MKILVFAHNNHLYGANRSLVSILHFLKNNNDVSVVLPSKGDFQTELSRLDIPCHNIFYFPFFLYFKLRLKYLALPIMWFWNILAFPYLLLRVKLINPDIIYSNTAAENMGVLIAKTLGIKHVWHVREFMDKDHGATFIFGRKGKSIFFNLSNGLIFVSRAVSKNIIIKKANILTEVIYNGISASKKSDCFRIRGNGNVLKLGVVGVIDESKGQDRAIKCLPELLKVNKDVQLHIYGQNGGGYLKYLKNLIDNYQLRDKVFFEGFVNNISDIYKDIDILLMTSRNEAFGRVTIEAMLNGIPVIGFNSGGTPELIENGETGFLFNDQIDLISAFERLNDLEMYNYISEKARINAEINFTEEEYVVRVLNFIIKVFKKS